VVVAGRELCCNDRILTRACAEVVALGGGSVEHDDTCEKIVAGAEGLLEVRMPETSCMKTMVGGDGCGCGRVMEREKKTRVRVLVM